MCIHMHVTAVTYNGWHSLTIHSVLHRWTLDGGHAQPQGQSVLFFFPVCKLNLHRGLRGWDAHKLGKLSLFSLVIICISFCEQNGTTPCSLVQVCSMTKYRSIILLLRELNRSWESKNMVMTLKYKRRKGGINSVSVLQHCSLWKISWVYTCLSRA